MLLLLGHRLNLLDKAPRTAEWAARLLQYTHILGPFLQTLDHRRTATFTNSTSRKATLLYTVCISKLTESYCKFSPLVVSEKRLKAVTATCKESKAWQLCATIINFIYSKNSRVSSSSRLERRRCTSFQSRILDSLSILLPQSLHNVSS